MNRVEQFRHRRPSTALYVLTLLVLLVAQGQSRGALAQGQWETNGNNINNTNTGNVGVGTTAPGAKFTVSNNAGAAPAGQPGTVAQFVGPNGGIVRLLIDSFGATTSSLDLRRANNTAASPSALFAGDIIGQITWQAFGGTAYKPGSRIAIAGFAAENYSDTAQGSYLTFATTPKGAITRAEVMRLDSTGNVGIGTAAPEQPLHVNGPLLSTGAFAGFNFRERGSSNGNDTWVWYSTGSVARLWRMGDLLAVTPAGNVGIGTTAPTERLHVVGNINVTGNINAKYQDVAEWVPSTQSLAPGTVVVLDAARPNHVVASSAAYDTRVAGVVSAQPGVLLGERGEGKLMVATTGRVKVRVDATRGPVLVGDLLVTSDVEGLAMKSEPALVGGRQMHLPGTLIGKALEPLGKGVGEILVLLSLQ